MQFYNLPWYIQTTGLKLKHPSLVKQPAIPPFFLKYFMLICTQMLYILTGVVVIIDLSRLLDIMNISSIHNLKCVFFNLPWYIYTTSFNLRYPSHVSNRQYNLSYEPILCWFVHKYLFLTRAVAIAGCAPVSYIFMQN